MGRRIVNRVNQMGSKLKEKWLESVITVIMLLILTVNVGMASKLIEHDKDIAIIKDSRFTNEQGQLLRTEVAQLIAQIETEVARLPHESPSPEVLRWMKSVNDRLTEIERSLRDMAK